MSALVDKALKAKRESKSIDFKRSFNPNETGEWCEIIKDIVAMANSGGGVIVVGLANDGSLSGEDVAPVPARVKVVVAAIMQPTAEYSCQSNAPL